MAVVPIWYRETSPGSWKLPFRCHLEELGFFPLEGNRESLKVLNRLRFTFRKRDGQGLRKGDSRVGRRKPGASLDVG